MYFYNARWYDPYLNHFTQPDTIVPDSYNSQDWNRYAYVRYNPLRYTDPTGHCTVGGFWMSNDSQACKWASIESSIPKPSNQCVGDCYDAFLTYKSVAHHLGRLPSLKEVLYMTADTEYTLWADSHGVRAFGQEGLARNYYERCSTDGCQGDELYDFLKGYQPWSDWSGIENNQKTPGERAALLVGTLKGDKSWLWDDVTQILDITYATKQRWTDGKWTGEPWQWFGPFTPSRTCKQNVTPYIGIRSGNGTNFWMLVAEEDAKFGSYCR